MGLGWAKIKRQQADEANKVAAYASGIGEYGVANANYKLARILRKQAEEIEAREMASNADKDS